jgi:hypothetical protein
MTKIEELTQARDGTKGETIMEKFLPFDEAIKQFQQEQTRKIGTEEFTLNTSSISNGHTMPQPHGLNHKTRKKEVI